MTNNTPATTLTTFQSIEISNDIESKSTIRTINVITPIDSSSPTNTSTSLVSNKNDNILHTTSESAVVDVMPLSSSKRKGGAITEGKKDNKKKKIDNGNNNINFWDKKFACPLCSKGFLTQPGLDYHMDSKTCSNEMPTKQCSLCLKNKKKWSFTVGEWDKVGERQCQSCISPEEKLKLREKKNKKKNKKKKKLELKKIGAKRKQDGKNEDKETNKNEDKATELVASLSQSNLELADNVVKSWNFKENRLMAEGKRSIFKSATIALGKNIPDAGNIALIIRKLGVPNEKISRAKYQDEYLPVLGDAIRHAIRSVTKKECLAPVYDKNSRVTCSPEEARRKMERMYQRLGFADAKERALKGLEESKRGKGITE